MSRRRQAARPCPTPSKRRYSAFVDAQRSYQNNLTNPVMRSMVIADWAYKCQCGAWHRTHRHDRYLGGGCRSMSDELEPDYDTVITFETTRGSFEVPARLLADDLDYLEDFELRRLFAIHLPDRAPGVLVTTSKVVHRGGGATITWRRTVTHVARA